jgi:hypothetical protein
MEVGRSEMFDAMILHHRVKMVCRRVVNFPIDICSEHTAGNTSQSDSKPLYFACVSQRKAYCKVKGIFFAVAFSLLEAGFLRNLFAVANERFFTA